MAIIRFFDIKRLKPFHREGDTMPKPAPEKADQLSQLDPDLRPDEQSYVNHYLGYADILLRDEKTTPDSGDHNNILELPTIQEAEPTESEDDESGNAA